MKNKHIATDLVGMVIEKREHDPAGDGAWPINMPNRSGEHIATVRAVWLDETGHVMLAAMTPSGHTFETYLLGVKVAIDMRGGAMQARG